MSEALERGLPASKPVFSLSDGVRCGVNRAEWIAETRWAAGPLRLERVQVRTVVPPRWFAAPGAIKCRCRGRWSDASANNCTLRATLASRRVLLLAEANDSSRRRYEPHSTVDFAIFWARTPSSCAFLLKHLCLTARTKTQVERGLLHIRCNVCAFSQSSRWELSEARRAASS